MPNMKEPPAGAVKPSFRRLAAGTRLYRIWNHADPYAGVLKFRANGPRHRFDHHRVVGAGPADDPERSILYAGKTFSCAFVETLSELGPIDLSLYSISEIILRQKVRLLDLRGGAAMRAGTIAAISSVRERKFTQQWAREFYENPAFQGPQGLCYRNAHNHEEAYAFFERALPAFDSTLATTKRLDSLAWRDAAYRIAKIHNLVILP